ncbi:MAG: hypothetical protein ACRDZ4_10310 [Egibacteraceae bacterium]
MPWIDDNPQLNRHEVETPVRITTQAAVALLKEPSRQVVVGVSNVGREGRPKAGLEDVERLLTEGRYDGPIVFSTSRVTPAWRDEAMRLRAFGITADPGGLYGLLAEVALSRGPR